MKGKDFLAIFKDGTRVVIRNIDGYTLDRDNKIVRVEKNNYNSFFNFEEIRYCGNEWNLNNRGD